MLTTAYLWRVVTHLGAAGLLLPVLAIAAVGLWQSGQQAAVRIWLLSLALATALTLTSKMLFFGWGIGVASLDFTGISGHALLASSVLPVFCNWQLASERQRISVAGVILGLLLVIGIGLSRVVLGAHSQSEVIAAWMVGALVSGLALNAMGVPTRRPWFARAAPLVLLLAFGSTASSYLPTHDWEVDLSLWLSGRSQPYTRAHLGRAQNREPGAGSGGGQVAGQSD
jgi:membrane-associated phospholipid phosphatase